MCDESAVHYEGPGETCRGHWATEENDVSRASVWCVLYSTVCSTDYSAVLTTDKCKCDIGGLTRRRKENCDKVKTL